jgi:hypothetical protein
VDEEQTSQVSSEAAEVAATGTADTSATDVASRTEDATGATPPDAGTAPEATDAAAEGQAATEGSDEEPKTRRERQREARKQPPAPVKTADEIIAEYEAKRADEARRAEAAKARTDKLARYLGSDEELAELERVINQPPPSDLYRADLDEQNQRNAEVARAIARRTELLERRSLLTEYGEPLREAIQQAERQQALTWLDEQFRKVGAAFELDPDAAIAAAVGKPEPMTATLSALVEQGRAPLLEEVADLKDQLAARDSELEAYRQRLGGRAPQVDRGGVLANGNLTREQFLALPKDQKDRIRREQPGLLNDIYSRSA